MELDVEGERSGPRSTPGSAPSSTPGSAPSSAPRGIAVIAPYDFALDHELWQWTPPGVTLHVTRTPYRGLPVTVEMAGEISDLEMVRRVARSVVTPRPEVAVYACAAGSFVRGVQGEWALRAAIRQAGVPVAVTSAGALLLALRTLGVRRLAVATPYVPEVTGRLHSYLAEGGIATVSSSHLGLLRDIWTTVPPAVADLVRRADHPHAEAIFVSCTNLPTYEVIASLELLLGKPVLTACQVTMWAALRAMGEPPHGDGQRLLAADPASRARASILPAAGLSGPRARPAGTLSSGRVPAR